MAVDGNKVRQLIELASGETEASDDGPGDTLSEMRVRPSAGAPHPKRLLTVAMATYDDFDGVYFSVQALRLYHPEVLDRVSILVLDNHPDGDAAWDLKDLEDRIPELRYVPSDEVRGTAVRDLLFAYATSEWVLCIDSHVLFEPGSLARLVDYLEAHADCDDLLQGPVTWDELDGRVATHFDPIWRAGMYGAWAVDERGLDRDAEPFEIPMQGLGCFAARRASWLGFNPRFQGFGGEEGYLHEKYRQHGRRTLCLPFLRWLHRFERPKGAQYTNRWEDRIRNYLIGWDELDLDPTDVVEHFAETVGQQLTEQVVARLAEQRRNAFWFFDAIYCINLDGAVGRWERMQRRFEQLEISDRVRRFSAIHTPECHNIGCTLSHRQIIQSAHDQRLENVLVLEDDAVFLEGTRWCLRASLEELRQRRWDVCHLGGHRWGKPTCLVSGCQHLEFAQRVSASPAVAYHRRIFDRILSDIPGDPTAVAAWCEKNGAIDQYLAWQLDGCDRFLTLPAVATQPNLRPQEDPARRDSFTI